MTAASGKSRQFCSVCKDWLDMEVVPTGDGDEDDGVVWYRCPQCQGFLPKLKGSEDEAPAPEAPAAEEAAPEAAEEDLPWDSPAAMMREMEQARDNAPPADENPEGDDDVLVGMTEVEPAASSPVQRDPGTTAELPVDPDAVSEILGDAPVDTSDKNSDTEGTEADEQEPILEYAAMLAESDVSAAVPYRPWDTYEVGQCVNHLAWDDCGVVVAKESLPGGRKAIKCYFEDAGVIRLIEQAPK